MNIHCIPDHILDVGIDHVQEILSPGGFLAVKIPTKTKRIPGSGLICSEWSQNTHLPTPQRKSIMKVFA